MLFKNLPTTVRMVQTAICGPCRWFIEAPSKRYQILIFFVFAVLTAIWIIIFISSDGKTLSYVLATAAAIIMSGYGANHFRLFLALKDDLDKKNELNRKFRSEHASLKYQFDKLSPL